MCHIEHLIVYYCEFDNEVSQNAQMKCYTFTHVLSTLRFISRVSLIVT